MSSCLYTGTVRHRRSRPRVHDFRYGVFMFYLDLDPDALAELARRVPLFSVNRWNAVSFHDRDHMDRRPGCTRDKVRRFLSDAELPLTDGRIFLLTSCRILGHVFNPISLYYCHQADGTLAAVVAEVSNTFGGQHLYLLRHPLGGGVDGPLTRRYLARKALHVSPFISMDATYEFHLSPVGSDLAVSIVEHEAGAHVLDAQLWGRRRPLTTATLARTLLTYPLMTLQTVVGIHSQALRLYLKGVPTHPTPAPTPIRESRVRPRSG